MMARNNPHTVKDQEIIPQENLKGRNSGVAVATINKLYFVSSAN
jgi:hypothetical protein